MIIAGCVNVYVNTAIKGENNCAYCIRRSAVFSFVHLLCPTHTLSQPIVHSFHSCLISKCCCVRCIISSPSVRCNFVPFASPFHSLHHFKSVLFAVSFQVRSFRCIISSPFYSLYRYHFKFVPLAIVHCIRCIISSPFFRCIISSVFYSLYHFKFVPFAIVRSICCIISSSPLFAVSFQVLCTHCIQSMSSRCFVHCCDPLKSHTRKRILGGGSHSMRPIPNSLIIKFPSLHLTRKH